MPATDQTWYNQRACHVAFAGASVLLLLGTILLLAKDHAKEYTRYQEKAHEIAQWTVRARVDQDQSEAYRQKKEEYEAEVRAAESSAVDISLIEGFVGAVKDHAEGGESVSGVEELLELTQNVNALALVVDTAREKVANSKGAEADQARTELNQAEQAATDRRKALLAKMNRWVKEAQLAEDNLTRATKEEKAVFSEADSERGLRVHAGEMEQVAKIQKKIDTLKESVAQLTAELAQAQEYRETLEGFMREMTAGESAAKKHLADLESEIDRLRQQIDTLDKTFAEWFLSLPILDAFYTGDRGIDPGWLPNLTIDFNFSKVARFDRCATCHQAINQTAPGTASEPAYDSLHTVVLKLTPPEDPPEGVFDSEGNLTDPEKNLWKVYGLRMAPQGSGRFNADDVTVYYTGLGSLAARAGLQMGDVIVSIDDGPIERTDDVAHYLLRIVKWGQPVKVQVRRGVPHPYASHPRLDLYMTDMSPHPKLAFGCTICHDGQGSATEFRWASHSPNNPQQADEWFREHGWFDNAHWIFPQHPKRFLESGCLKCHHEVLELEPSERFPEPPAPKLVAGFKVVREYGCFGCHEINGYDGPDRRIGPDLRVEPNYHAAALAILQDKGLSEEERDWANRLVQHPYDDGPRQKLLVAISEDKQLADELKKRRNAGDSDALGEDGAEEETISAMPRLSATTHRLADLLKDAEAPGKERKAGPSLRYLSKKVGYEFLIDWIRYPRNYRPSTRMPQFFGMYEHLNPEEGLRDAVRFEPIEIRALADYLLHASEKQPFEYLPHPRIVTEEASAERGKLLFQTRGCLACHSHDAFPGIAEHQGPNLSRAGAKFDNEIGRKWLYSWVKQPTHYHARTKMPNLFLEPIQEKDPLGKPTGKVTDPAADIAAFLLTSGTDWKPEAAPQHDQWSDEEKKNLFDLALEHLTASFPERKAREYLQKGIPESMAEGIKQSEKSLVGITDENRLEKQLEYVGQQTINKYGCFGCHDIPGYEAAKPIGTALADWGRKETSKLAFEQIERFLATHGLDGKKPHDNSGDSGEGGGESRDHEPAGAHGISAYDDGLTPDEGYYIQALTGHHREGFIWQKLRMPRSYDYEKTTNKGYNERLRMPRFTFNYRRNQSPEENERANTEAREEVITFVLGLVSEPPSEQYIYHPDARRKAVMDGRLVLYKYNCAGCHTLLLDRWALDYRPPTKDELGDFEEPAPVEDYPFLRPRFSRKQIADSLVVNHRGLRTAVVHGRPTRDEKTGKIVPRDMDGTPFDPEDPENADLERYYQFVLWDSALIDGRVQEAGLHSLMVPDRAAQRTPAWGGRLARYLFPVVIADEQRRNPQVKGSEAWGWLPPVLVGEGWKARTDWLHDFLLDPYRIRPAAVLRMPKFNMSPAEASVLANYFAAADGADYPYEFNSRRREQYVETSAVGQNERLENAMKIVLDSNYCVKCHTIGDYHPEGSPTGLGPDLAKVYGRLRPEWVRDWVANPKRILPYTGMPVNIPYNSADPHLGGVSQELFPGTSVDQLDGLVDLLMNFDYYIQRQTSVKDRVPAPAPASSGDAAEGTASGPKGEETGGG